MNKITPGQILIVSGMSGAGLSSALKDLEDLGFEVFDNFPLSLIPPLLSNPSSERPIAIGIDTRTRGFAPMKIIELKQLYNAQLLFMSCDEAALQKRFTETRRRHPLSSDRPVSAGIKKEMALLYPLREAADLIIDTTDFNIHDLRRFLNGHFNRNKAGDLTVHLLSFGFKNGIPREADIMMDVRFLRNPHWEPDLKPMTGLDRQVQEYIQADPSVEQFLAGFQTMLQPLLKRYREEGKNYLTLAFGCTGGRHRSVYVVSRMAQWLDKIGVTSSHEHRDMHRP